MGKSRQLSLELWPLIDVILFSYIELIFRGGVSCLPAALLFFQCYSDIIMRFASRSDISALFEPSPKTASNIAKNCHSGQNDEFFFILMLQNWVESLTVLVTGSPRRMLLSKHYCILSLKRNAP